MLTVAQRLAQWAVNLQPSVEDLELAQRSLLDTVAVTLAGRDHEIARLSSVLDEGPRWAAIGHVLDYDDLHMESTTHISVVCVSAALAAGGDARSYLAAAGVMARLGMALGWSHYKSGWHITCTAGAPAAAVAAGVALGLDADQIATAIALAVPGAGGVQRAFGTDGKSLQVGFAVATGLAAARLASAGATADLGALEMWMELVGGSPDALDLSGPAVPGGLAIKLYPCCYALQRPISAISSIADAVGTDTITRIVLTTPEATVVPLRHDLPTTGLQAKFSLEYAAAIALLDEQQGFDSFTDSAVRRPDVRRLVELVTVTTHPGGNGLLDGMLEAEVHTSSGQVLRVRQQFPPGSPQNPPTPAELRTKLDDCLAGLDMDPRGWTWANAAGLLRTTL